MSTEHARPFRSAAEVITAMVDPDTFRSWDTRPDPAAWGPRYARQLEEACLRADGDEAVITGEALINSHPVAMIVSDFEFLGGSVGQVAAGRILKAVHRATTQRYPLIASSASGGTRMQEGTPAFTQMIPISHALAAHRRAGLPYLTHLRHPTTGGVYASWGSLGQICVAEPGALVGFLGPRVIEGVLGYRLPADTQRAEHLVDVGVLDGVASVTGFAEIVGRVLNVTGSPRRSGAADPVSAPALRPVQAPWETVLRSRGEDRIAVRDLLAAAATDVTYLRGTRRGQYEPHIVVALCRLEGIPCVVVGQDRSTQITGKHLGTASLRQAQRGMEIASELDLPLVTFIDTPGAALDRDAEEDGLAGEIARCIVMLGALRVPTVSVLLGQGCGGAALALLGADSRLACEAAWLAPLPLEGASTIVHGDPTHAAEMASSLRITAAELLDAGIIRAIIAEPASESRADFSRRIAANVCREILRNGRPVTASDWGRAADEGNSSGRTPH